MRISDWSSDVCSSDLRQGEKASRSARHQDTYMLSLFQRKRPPVAAAPSPAPDTDLPNGLLRPESAASLLATPRRQTLLEHLWHRTSPSPQQFATPSRKLERA